MSRHRLWFAKCVLAAAALPWIFPLIGEVVRCCYGGFARITLMHYLSSTDGTARDALLSSAARRYASLVPSADGVDRRIAERLAALDSLRSSCRREADRAAEASLSQGLLALGQGRYSDATASMAAAMQHSDRAIALVARLTLAKAVGLSGTSVGLDTQMQAVERIWEHSAVPVDRTAHAPAAEVLASDSDIGRGIAVHVLLRVTDAGGNNAEDGVHSEYATELLRVRWHGLAYLVFLVPNALREGGFEDAQLRSGLPQFPLTLYSQQKLADARLVPDSVSGEPGYCLRLQSGRPGWIGLSSWRQPAADGLTVLWGMCRGAAGSVPRIGLAWDGPDMEAGQRVCEYAVSEPFAAWQHFAMLGRPPGAATWCRVWVINGDGRHPVDVENMALLVVPQWQTPCVTAVR